MTTPTIPETLDPPPTCGQKHLTARVLCEKPHGHDGGHVAETSAGIWAWGIDYTEVGTR